MYTLRYNIRNMSFMFLHFLSRRSSIVIIIVVIVSVIILLILLSSPSLYK